MRIILGIDPGSRLTGFGLIGCQGSKYHYISSGCIKTETADMTQRLRIIFQDVQEIIREYQPNEAAIEQVFVHKNANSALKLGQARGAAIVALATNHLSVSEYSARQVKQAVVGYGAASKDQMQKMICCILSLSKSPQADAADALGIALCHANSSQNPQLLGANYDRAY